MAYETLIDELKKNPASDDSQAVVDIMFPEGITLYDAAMKLQENNICDAQKFLYYFNAGNLGYDNNYSTGSYDWDRLLDSYEKYVDKYIAVIRKINSGDASVANEYASLLMQAQDLDKRIRDCSGDLSAAQLSRYQRINNKLLQAAQELRH